MKTGDNILGAIANKVYHCFYPDIAQKGWVSPNENDVARIIKSSVSIQIWVRL